MAQNLQARLRRIRDAGKNAAGASEKDSPDNRAAPAETPNENSPWLGWSDAGFKTLKRKLLRALPFPLPSALPGALPILVPDLLRIGKIPGLEELLFFDLETTGLSGGAGTLAFLAAFGRFKAPAGIEITQYLLLDYPGENGFIERVTEEFKSPSPPFVVSYNGKCFDSQILRNRCLMNGIMTPGYHQVDLLHPARRLWKRVLPDCSQATVETAILGLDRAGDVPGALAPDIWFSFLRSGENRELLLICDHNVRDITGLASMFLAMGEIAAEPFETGRESGGKYRFDEEALALCWARAARNNPSFYGEEEKRTGGLLLESAARRGFPLAGSALAADFFKEGRCPEARALLKSIAEGGSGGYAGNNIPVSGCLKAAVLRSLAVDAEWRLGDIPLAASYASSALAVPGITGALKSGLEKRLSRLRRKGPA
jgi:uncharacterized protein YprB with RNaseH-like and TPR domain